MGCCQSCWGSSGLGGCPRAERSLFSVQQAGKHPDGGTGLPSDSPLSFSNTPAPPSHLSACCKDTMQCGPSPCC